MVEMPRGILEKKHLTGTKGLCSGKSHKKGGCQHRGTQEIVELIWTQDAFKREEVSTKSSWRLFWKEKKGTIPYESHLKVVWTLKLRLRAPGKPEERRRSSSGLQGSGSPGWTLLTRQVSEPLKARPFLPASQPAPLANMHKGRYFLIWMPPHFSLLRACQALHIWGEQIVPSTYIW